MCRKQMGTRKKIVFNTLILLLLTLTRVAEGQEFMLKQYTVADGLVQMQVNALFEDSRGYLWVCTRAGVSRFDGYEFKNYTKREGLGETFCYGAQEDKHGIIWITHPSGISAISSDKVVYYKPGEDDLRLYGELGYNKEKDHFIIAGYNTTPDLIKKIYHLSKDAGFEDVTKHYPKLIAVANGRNKTGSFHIQYDNENQIIYVITHNKVDVFNFDGSWLKQHKMDALDAFEVTSTKLISDLRGNLYTTSVDTIKKILSHGTREFFTDLAVSPFDSLSIAKDNQNKIYFKTVSSSTFQKTATSIDHFIFPYFTKNGTLWLGTDGGGLYKVLSTTLLSYRPAEGGMLPYVWNMAETDEGMLFGSADGEAVLLENHSTFQKINTSNFKGGIDRILYDKIMFYFGSINNFGGYTMMSVSHRIVMGYKNRKFVNLTDELLSDGYCMIEDKTRRKALVGSNRGLVVFNEDMSYELWEGVPKNQGQVLSVSIDKSNRYWVGNSHGMATFENGKISQFPNKEIGWNMGARAQLRDSRGNLWIGNDLGLFHYHDRGNPRQVAPDVVNAMVVSLAEAPEGYLLVGTLKGLVLLDLKRFYNQHIEQTIFLNESMGFGGTESAQNCLLRDSKGFYWIPTPDRVIKFDLKGFLRDSVNIPEVVIERPEVLQADMKWIAEGNSDSETGAMLFDHNQTNLRFHFTALKTKYTENTRYRHKLDGNDADWSEWSTERNAVYTNLKPGEYTLLAEAMNPFNKKSATASVTVIIAAAWYQTLLFKALVALTLTALVVGITLYYNNMARHKKLMAKETERVIARLQLKAVQNQMDPHFIFNALNSIGASVFHRSKDETYSFIQRFARLIRITLDNSERLIRPVEREIDFVKNYLDIEIMRFGDKISYELNVDEKVNPSRLVPKMIVYNWVENAIKHGIGNKTSNGLITIDISQSPTALLIRVTDDGVGRAAASGFSSGTRKGENMLKEMITTFNRFSPDPITVEIRNLNPDNDQNPGTEVLVVIPNSFKGQLG